MLRLAHGPGVALSSAPKNFRSLRNGDHVAASAQGVLKLAHGPNAIFTAAIGKGNILATGGGDNNLKLWEIVGEEGGGGGGGGGGGPKMPLAPLATLSSHSGDVVSCAFRPNSRWEAGHGRDDEAAACGSGSGGGDCGGGAAGGWGWRVGWGRMEGVLAGIRWGGRMQILGRCAGRHSQPATYR